jgi:hypothetical protein
MMLLIAMRDRERRPDRKGGWRWRLLPIAGGKIPE